MDLISRYNFIINEKKWVYEYCLRIKRAIQRFANLIHSHTYIIE